MRAFVIRRPFYLLLHNVSPLIAAVLWRARLRYYTVIRVGRVYIRYNAAIVSAAVVDGPACARTRLKIKLFLFTMGIVRG